MTGGKEGNNLLYDSVDPNIFIACLTLFFSMALDIVLISVLSILILKILRSVNNFLLNLRDLFLQS